MEGMGGRELVTRMRSDSELSKVPVLILTAYAEDLPVPGAAKVLRKPCTPAELLDCVQGLLPAA